MDLDVTPCPTSDLRNPRRAGTPGPVSFDHCGESTSHCTVHDDAARLPAAAPKGQTAGAQASYPDPVKDMRMREIDFPLPPTGIPGNKGLCFDSCLFYAWMCHGYNTSTACWADTVATLRSITGPRAGRLPVWRDGDHAVNFSAEMRSVKGQTMAHTPTWDFDGPENLRRTSVTFTVTHLGNAPTYDYLANMFEKKTQHVVVTWDLALGSSGDASVRSHAVLLVCPFFSEAPADDVDEDDDDFDSPPQGWICPVVDATAGGDDDDPVVCFVPLHRLLGLTSSRRTDAGLAETRRRVNLRFYALEVDAVDDISYSKNPTPPSGFDSAPDVATAATAHPKFVAPSPRASKEMMKAGECC